ncbi:9864_t:CDS:10 [Funneliformis geosporum]|nr:9864_t:CDS:10 [Funneliformis geosporum]
MEQFTSPNFFDLDLEQLLTGDDLLHDSQAIGIMKVDIFEARNLTKVDVSGENDPYVISSLDPSPYMHTHSNTRVVENCANPVWRETFFHKIPELDIVDEHIKFKLCVMDWDRFTTDDHIGSTWIDIKDAIGNGEKETLIHDGWKNLKLQPKDTSSQGELCFRLEYYPKLSNQIEAQPDQTAGIFCLKIHQAMNLQITTAPYIEDSGITMSDNYYNTSYPNPYAVVYLNDSRVFRTRAKLNNVAPFWNASTEQFVKDWKTAIVRVVIKDQKDLEYDPVIGMVTLPLKELFEQKEKKQPNGMHCDMALVVEKGYDVGTLLINSITAEGLDDYYANRSVYLTLTLTNTEIEQDTEVTNKFPPTWLEPRSINDTKNRMEFAVFRRYRTSLKITLKCKGIFGIYHTLGTVEYWLRNIKDCRETEVELPIFENLPKYFPNLDITESNQNFNDYSIPICESPTSLIIKDFDASSSLCNLSLVEKEVNLEKDLPITSKELLSTVCSTDAIPSEEFGESSQKTHNDMQKYAHDLDVTKSNVGKLSIITQFNGSNDNMLPNNKADSDVSTSKHSKDKQSVESSLKTTEETKIFSKKSVDNTPEESMSSEVPPTIPQESSTTTENLTNNLDPSYKRKGYLRFKVYFRPGLSLAHEKEVKRSLTGANASILYQNPFCTMEDIEEQQKREREQRRQATNMYKERSIPSGETYESETGMERRINRVHRRRTMRQLQWVTDLLKAKVVSISGKREWEDQEIIEHEV